MKINEKSLNMPDMSESICDPSNDRQKGHPINTLIWNEPVPLDTLRLPYFPLIKLPQVFMDYAISLSAYMQASANMIGWQLIYISAGSP